MIYLLVEIYWENVVCRTTVQLEFQFFTLQLHVSKDLLRTVLCVQCTHRLYSEQIIINVFLTEIWGLLF